MLRIWSTVGLIIGHSVALVFRERTVFFLTVLFMALVVVSAYLGWSATTTVNAIYKSAAVFLASAHQPVPPNPVLNTSPLSLLRNMSTYVSLIGSLASIVIGFQLIAMDRKGGVMPLLGVRPLSRYVYAMAKILALMMLVLGLVGAAAFVSIVTFQILPQFKLQAMEWAHLTLFFGVSALYMVMFGLMGLASGAFAKSETMGLLIPVTIWLTVTFIFPQITSNINPTAALNPIKALYDPPNSSFFKYAGLMLGPLSLTDAYKIISAQWLEFLPPTFVVRSAVSPMTTLVLTTGLSVVAAVVSLCKVDMTRGDYNV